MKNLIVVLLLLAVAAAPLFAADMVTMEAKNGNVTFNHKAHSESMDCQSCHKDQDTPSKLELDKDAAHALCKGCHQEKGGGPTKCGECHKK